MAIRISETAMVSDVCSAHARRVDESGEQSWLIGPADFFGPRAGRLRLTRDKATTAMVLAELYALGLADTDKHRLRVQRYRADLGW